LHSASTRSSGIRFEIGVANSIPKSASNNSDPFIFYASCQSRCAGRIPGKTNRAGRSKDWVKVKNRKHPAYRRVQDQFYGASA
jgi:hypothetical protein